MNLKIELSQALIVWTWVVLRVDSGRGLAYGSAADYTDACKDALVAYQQITNEEK